MLKKLKITTYVFTIAISSQLSLSLALRSSISRKHSTRVNPAFTSGDKKGYHQRSRPQHFSTPSSFSNFDFIAFITLGFFSNRLADALAD